MSLAAFCDTSAGLDFVDGAVGLCSVGKSGKDMVCKWEDSDGSSASCFSSVIKFFPPPIVSVQGIRSARFPVEEILANA
jgi:hypothetical protein